MATPGTGTKLSIDTSATDTPSYVEIAEVIEITPPTYEREAVDTSHMGSTDGVKTFIPGDSDWGEVAFTIQYDVDAASHQGIAAQLYKKTTTKFKLTLADAGDTEIPFVGFIKSFAAETPKGGRVTAKVGVKVSGKVTFPTS